MRKQLLFLTIPIFLLTLIIACNKYSDTTPAGYDGELPEDKQVVASLQGKVLDENGLPVTGAEVTSNDVSTTTDEHGVFNFHDIKMSSRWGFVKVVKQGYFAGSRTILVTAGSANFVSIRLMPRTSKGSFAAAGGGTIVVQAGDTVAFDPSSIVTAATNAAYSGAVHVYAAYLDPLAADAAGRMPGDLRGIDGEGKETLLQSFGMMVVELEGDAGEKLQIAGGKKAAITMKIPDALKGSAPATIPLWYFNDTTGKWIQQGIATRKGDLYCGETTHFSWWNCDAPTGAVSFHVRLNDAHGNPVAYSYLQFTSPTLGTRGGYTDADGNASGLIPRGQTMRLEALNSCGSIYFGVNAGPASADLELGTLTVSDDRAILTLTGTVVNCNGAAVDSGYVQAIVDGLQYRVVVVKGTFSLAMPRCGSAGTDAALVLGDYRTLQQSSTISVPVTSGSIDAGKLTACGSDITQYYNIVFKGKTYNLTVPPDSVSFFQTSTYLFFGFPDDYGTEQISLFWGIHADQFKGVGTYKIFSSYVTLGDLAHPEHYVENPEIAKRPDCTIKTYGAVNEFVTGSLIGEYKDSTGVWYPLTCDFKVKRTK